MSSFPTVRLRRLRGSEPVRRLARETSLAASDFIYPFFVVEGRDVRQEIGPMPGCYQLSIDRLLPEVVQVARLGISGVLLFGIPDSKDAQGSEAYNPDGVVQQAVRAIKGETPELAVPLQLMQMMVQWPLTSLLQIGALGGLEPDFKQQLGLEQKAGE